ncbi:zinc finger, CCHC-type containing protein, partial [Tanacetum coccineum]
IYHNKGKGKEVGGPSVNMTEEGKNKHNKKTKTGHFKRDCRSGNKKNANAGGSGKGSKDHFQDQDIRTSEDGSVLYMGDDHFAPVHGIGSVALEFSSRKTITLFNVLYVPKLHKNLVSGPDLVIITMHARLGHVHYKRMLEMYKDDIIPGIDENPEKCTTLICVIFMLHHLWEIKGIIHETTAPYTLQQNGVAKRKNRALKKMVNSMLSYLGLSEGFWGEAMLTACYLLNMVSNKRNKTTPYELWFYVIEPNDSVSINSIIESRDVIFDENCFSSILRLKDIIPNFVESQRDDNFDDVPSEIPKPRKGKRVRKAKSYGSDF